MRFSLALFFFSLGALYAFTLTHINADPAFMPLMVAFVALGSWLAYLLEGQEDDARMEATILPPEDESKLRFPVDSGPARPIERTQLLPLSQLPRPPGAQKLSGEPEPAEIYELQPREGCGFQLVRMHPAPHSLPSGQNAGLIDLDALMGRSPRPVFKPGPSVMSEDSHLAREREAAKLIDVKSEGESALNVAIANDRRRKRDDC